MWVFTYIHAHTRIFTDRYINTYIYIDVEADIRKQMHRYEQRYTSTHRHISTRNSIPHAYTHTVITKHVINVNTKFPHQNKRSYCDERNKNYKEKCDNTDYISIKICWRIMYHRGVLITSTNWHVTYTSWHLIRYFYASYFFNPVSVSFIRSKPKRTREYFRRTILQ